MTGLGRFTLRFAVFILFASGASPAQLRLRGRFTVTREAAEKAVAEGLFREETVPRGVVVRPLTDAVASSPSAPLDVIGVEATNRQGLATSRTIDVLVRLGCHVRSACVPFYARVTLPDTPASLSNEVPSLGAAIVSVASADRSARSRHAGPRAAIVLRRGDHATLVLEDGSARVEMPVVTLKDAAAGESVRVASLDRKRVYAARAVSSTELKGEF